MPPALVVAAPATGNGKTTVVCAVSAPDVRATGVIFNRVGGPGRVEALAAWAAEWLDLDRLVACAGAAPAPRGWPRTTTRGLMVQGTASGVGTSWVATGIGALPARRALRVAPVEAVRPARGVTSGA